MSEPGAATARQHAVDRASFAPSVDETAISFRLPDPDRRLRSVRLFQELERPRPGPEFRRNHDGTTWELRWRKPPADRLEYQFEVETLEGNHELIRDPSNPATTGGPFGDRSVLELPSYRAPRWLDATAPEGSIRPLSIRSRILHADVYAEIWAPEGTRQDAALPILIVHDGPEFDRYSALTRYLSYLVEHGGVAPFRAALLAPHERNETYSASATYARAFTHDLIPGLAANVPIAHGRSARIGMGASLGALSMLHIHRRSPSSLGGLFLQSGSFFRLRYDKQESDFPRFRRISRFVGVVLSSPAWAHTVPVTMTCGLAEENLANNRAVRDALRTQGYDVDWGDVRDAHNWIAWRDSFHPHLEKLMQRAWGRP